jgi:hypothetical protein
MGFIKVPPQWDAPGVEPPTLKRTDGWIPGDKPPADYLNWFQNRAYEALVELQAHAHTGASGDAPQIGTSGIALKAVTAAQLADNTITSSQLGAGAATDTVLGSRTATDSVTPSFTGELTPLVSSLFTLLKGVTGKSSALTAPAITLETVSGYLDQSVKTGDSPTFAGATIGSLGVNSLFMGLNSIIFKDANFSIRTDNSTNRMILGAYNSGLDYLDTQTGIAYPILHTGNHNHQAVGTGDAPTFANLAIQGNVNGGVTQNIRNSSAGSNAFAYIQIGNDTAENKLVMFTNSSTRTTDGGAGNSTIRTDSGNLLLGAGGGVRLTLTAAGAVQTPNTTLDDGFGNVIVPNAIGGFYTKDTGGIARTLAYMDGSNIARFGDNSNTRQTLLHGSMIITSGGNTLDNGSGGATFKFVTSDGISVTAQALTANSYSNPFYFNYINSAGGAESKYLQSGPTGVLTWNGDFAATGAASFAGSLTTNSLLAVGSYIHLDHATNNYINNMGYLIKGANDFYVANHGNNTVLFKVTDTGNTTITGSLTAGAGGSFASSLATNGYQKLPGGFIRQWGQVTFSGSSTSGTFPIAFPNACLNMQASAFGSSNYIAGCFASSASAFTLYSSIGTSVTICWEAIGY